MTYAVIHAENADIVSTYSSRAAAEDHLAALVAENPALADEIGLRPYANGRPAGEFEAASAVLGERIAQGQLVPARSL